MDIRYPLIFITGKIIIYLSRLLNIGNGGTWPGEIALRIYPEILSKLAEKLKKGIILVAGTNGKTTTSLLLKQILEKNGDKVVHNTSGANLVNGIISAFIQDSDWMGNFKADWGIFEVDENSLPAVIEYCHSGLRAGIYKNKNGSRVKHGMTKQFIIVLLNLFRDQLDRYGEIDVIAGKWYDALSKLDEYTTLILNADDPQIAYLGQNVKAKVKYFGINEPKLYLPEMEHATDSIYCLTCGEKLTYIGTYYSHIGNWYCDKCKSKRPETDLSEYTYPLPGLYNRYNTLAAVLAAKNLGIKDTTIKDAVSHFQPAFGRQEEFEIEGKIIKIFLSKNPAGFNESLRTVLAIGAKQILFVLNDRIPDGRDVSWIWDVNFEMLPAYITPIISGDRTYDLALRIKYSMKQCNNETMQQLYVKENLKDAIHFCVQLDKSTPLYILATYSAMLDVRKILMGRKIL